MVKSSQIKFPTKGNGDIRDISGEIADFVAESGVKEGLIVAFVVGSTAGITTTEFEPGLKKDLPELMEKLVPSNQSYHHDKTWHDGNGFSHLRSSLIGPDIAIPITEGKLVLGTWQQVVFLEFDNRSRDRIVELKVIGE